MEKKPYIFRLFETDIKGLSFKVRIRHLLNIFDNSIQ